MTWLRALAIVASTLALVAAGCGGSDAEKVANDAEGLGAFDGSLPLVMPDGSTIIIKVKIWDPDRECLRTVLVEEANVDQVKLSHEDTPTAVVFDIFGTPLPRCH